jgi:HAMP domain-containing protein
MGILFGIFAIVVLWLNFFLKRSVIQPIRKMSRTAERVSTGEMSADFEQNSNDEIGILAASFNRMKSSLEIAMKLLSQQTR